MAKGDTGDYANLGQLLAELGRLTVETKAAKVKRVYEPRRYERAGQADFVTQGFSIEGAGDASRGSFLISCELRGEEQIAAAADALVVDRGISLKGTLVVTRTVDKLNGALKDRAKLVVSELRREW